MEVGVLGPTQVRRGDEFVDLGTRKQRGLLAGLALHAGRPVSTDAIIELLWADDPPATVTGTLQAYVSGLRRALEPGRGRRAPSALLVTIGNGYALRVPPEQLDAARFAAAVNTQHQRLSAVAALVPQLTRSRTTARQRLNRAELEATVAELDAALALWRGEPYLELDDAADARAERTRLAEFRLVATEDRSLASLWLGRQAVVAAELEALTAAHPVRERLWGLRALALARSGRQADALDVLRQIRELLDDELGLEPGADLQALQTAVLRQEPALAWTADDVGPGPTTTMPLSRASDEPGPVAPERSAPERSAPAPPAPAPPAPEPSAPGPHRHRPAGWSLVGRATELTALRSELDEAAAGGVRFASLIGEPGIGKTRLATELIEAARDRGLDVLTGRCSQDDGAPPLWPWSSVLRGLGRELPDLGDEQEVSQFAVWERIIEIVVGAARTDPVLVVLDDLHWADAATLRVLRLLAETTERSRLLVVTTWRSHPEPTGPLADLVEMLARRHALRIELGGLTADDAAGVVEGVTRARPTAGAADALRDRTDGNPFFLVEYARLAAERGDLEQALRAPDPPAAVSDVLSRRLQRLPDDTRTLLRTAAAIGRQFDLDMLVAGAGTSDDDALDALEPALAAGLVREDGIDRFSFAHALIRDTAYAELGASRRARLHARLAELLEHRPGRETERARHWSAAGVNYANRAWPAAVDAARLASRLHAHEQAAELLRDALTALEHDPAASRLDQFDVLMLLVDAYRWSSHWRKMSEVVQRATEVAEEIGDVELVAQAAMSSTIGSLWQSAPLGEVNERVVSALRLCLARLPTADGSTRCRVMLALAQEIYYGSTFAERSALIDEAIAMARRLDDPRLLLDTYQVATSALRAPETASRRLTWATESAALARDLGEDRAYVVSATLRAVALAELGEVDQMRQASADARAEAERLRILYALIVLDCLEVPWLAMAGDFEAAEEPFARVIRLSETISVEQSGDATVSALLPLRLWQGRIGELEPILAELGEDPVFLPVAVFFRLRSGDVEAARAAYGHGRVELPDASWQSLLVWAAAAGIAPWVEDRTLAADAYRRLAPFAGRSACVGSSMAMGPVDAYLALAAAAVGDSDIAARHADHALALMERWRIPLAADWFRDQRVRLGF